MFTEEMTRLCGEIVAMRNRRGSMMSELQQGAMERKRAVDQLCAHHGSARASMAKQTKSERAAFMSSLRRSVGGHLREVRNDLAGARRAWAGKHA